jgi:hypothetical protein
VLRDMAWEMAQPMTLSWGTLQARGTASIQVRSPERLETLATPGSQVDAIGVIIAQSLMDILRAQQPAVEELPVQLGDIASATLVAANSRLAAYGATLLDLSVDEITILS